MTTLSAPTGRRKVVPELAHVDSPDAPSVEVEVEPRASWWRCQEGDGFGEPVDGVGGMAELAGRMFAGRWTAAAFSDYAV